jgi:hypothetical protein
VISSFETDHTAVKRKIEQIEPTESTSNLSEAIALAEAYSQNLIIGGQDVGNDVPPERQAPPASTIILSDGRIEDADRLVIQRLSTDKMQIVTVGQRSDNVAIVAMSARRDHERPEVIEVFATVRNFGFEPVTLDADLLLDGHHADTQTFELTAGMVAPVANVDGSTNSSEVVGAGTTGQTDAGSVDVAGTSFRVQPGSMISVAFDEIPFEGGGTAEVVLKVQDALLADNRAVAVVPEARTMSVLLVTDGNQMLERVLAVLPIRMQTMTPEEYDTADEELVTAGVRSRFDVVMFDNHSTDRLPPGNYFFWGSIPKIEGMEIGEAVANDVIVHWEDNHPILRHVAVETIDLYQWRRIIPPAETEIIMEGEQSPVGMLLSRDGRNYFVMAFSLITRDESGDAFLNTFWFAQVDFVVFMYNSIQYLASNLEVENKPSERPGNPLQIHVPGDTDEIRIQRPDGTFEVIPTRGLDTVTYSKTRQNGMYVSEPSDTGRGRFAVNLFSATESMIEPAPRLALAGTELATAKAGSRLVNEHYWPWLLRIALVLLLVEWVIYNKRVFV